MKERRITEITLDTVATLTVRWRTEGAAAHREETRCSRCGSVAAILPHQAEAKAFRQGIRELVGDLGLDQIHFTRKEDGSHLVCLDSLRQAVPLPTAKSILQIQHDKENAQ